MAFNNSIGSAVSGSSAKIVGSQFFSVPSGYSFIKEVNFEADKVNWKPSSDGPSLGWWGAQSGNLAQGTRNHRSASGCKSFEYIGQLEYSNTI